MWSTMHSRWEVVHSYKQIEVLLATLYIGRKWLEDGKLLREGDKLLREGDKPLRKGATTKFLLTCNRLVDS